MMNGEKIGRVQKNGKGNHPFPFFSFFPHHTPTPFFFQPFSPQQFEPLFTLQGAKRQPLPHSDNYSSALVLPQLLSSLASLSPTSTLSYLSNTNNDTTCRPLPMTSPRSSSGPTTRLASSSVRSRPSVMLSLTSLAPSLSPRRKFFESYTFVRVE